jgi:hypothetical protein
MNAHRLRHLPEELRQSILQDGEVLRVPGALMDSKRTPPAKPTTDKLADGLTAAQHHSHWGMSKKRDFSCYDSYDKEISTAYQLKDDYGAQSRGSRVNDPCTCRGPEYPNAFGSPGTTQMVGGRLVCVPNADPRASDAARRPKDAKTIRDEAYRAYDEDISSAWKQPINEQTHDAKPRRSAGVVLHDTAEAAYGDYDAEISEAWKRG